MVKEVEKIPIFLFIMPEIAEVARIVYYIRKHLVGKTLSKVTASNDDNVYGKAGTSAAEFEKALSGKKIVDVGQQGKYFWMVMSSPPHPLMHFGMAGWLKMKSEHTYYYKTGKEEEETEWPPKYSKFTLETKEEPKVEAAFVDFRRFSRIRLLDCEASQIRKISPLADNGPDPVIDKDIVTEEWVREKCRAKKIPIKALLLDQGNISGIGNWVGDEILYNAKIHPEQYSNTLSDNQLSQLHKSIHYICSTACDLLGDSDQFPEDWLFKHRRGKRKKDAPKTLPNGEKIVFLTVGGRTSAVIPSVQKKTGPVAKEMDEAESDGESKKAKSKTAGKDSKKRKVKDEDEDDVDEEIQTQTNGTKPSKRAKSKANGMIPEKAATNGAGKKGLASSKENTATAKPIKASPKTKAVKKEETTPTASPRGRRSTRSSRG